VGARHRRARPRAFRLPDAPVTREADQLARSPRKHLFHFGCDAIEWRKITAVAARENISFAEAARALIRSCPIDGVLDVSKPPPSRKRRGAMRGAARPKALSAAAVETSAS
jgi:hypothetical protein